MKIKTTSGRRGNTTKPLSMDSSSTYQFGELQPIMCMEMEADSSVTAFVRSIVRLGVLNVPTFGRMKYRIDGRFVPMADIYRPFENFLAGLPFASNSKTYVPTSVPVISVGSLSAIILNMADCTIYRKNEGITAYDEWVPLRGKTDPCLVPNGAEIFAQFKYRFFANSDELTYIDDPAIVDYLGTRTQFSQFAVDEYVPSPYGDREDTSLLKWIQISPAAADFMFEIGMPEDPETGDREHYLLTFRLNNDARRLYKILTGCGWQFDLSNRDKVSFLPFLAFYKAQFDLYRPKNLTKDPMTFDQTPAHRLQEFIVDEDFSDLTYAIYNSQTESYKTPISLVRNFMIDLSVSTYFEETDYITSHIARPSTQGTKIQPNVTSPVYQNDSLNTVAGATAQAAGLPDLTGPTTAWNVRLLLKLLPYINKNTIVGGNIEKWLKVHGYGDLIQNSKSFAAGRYELPCRISDIDSVADTYNEDTQEGDLLGSYTGKGLGYSDANNPGTFKYQTNAPGYFILIATVIPMSRVSQGINPMLFHRKKLEFFDSAFDSLDFQVSRKSLVCGRREIDKGDADDSYIPRSPAEGSFGFIPRYSEYCYLPNVLNGGLSLRSNRASFISYTLDKYYENVQSYIKPLNETDWRCDLNVGYVVPIANPQLRNIANPLNGNFNRIFSRSQIVGGTRSDKIDQYNYEDDKFVIHNAIDVKYTSAKKPLGLSFETEDEGIDMTIDKE